MNFIVATMLMYCSEEQSFWILCSLIEDLLPDGYYTESLSGLRAAAQLGQLSFFCHICWYDDVMFSLKHPQVTERVPKC